MVDIHSHIIPFVDDGSKSMSESINLLIDAIKQGTTDIICTPHYRKRMFEKTKTEIIDNFNSLKAEVEKYGLKINLYLGQEIYCKSMNELDEYLQSDNFIVMNYQNNKSSKFLLLEFSVNNDTDISEIAYTTCIRGYVPIIAHVERYSYISLDDIKEIKQNALIQVNASSIVGAEGRSNKKRAMDYIVNGVVDFVSSDVHENKKNYLKKAYGIVKNKFGGDLAKYLFEINASKIIY